MSRIKALFASKSKKILSVYVTAGFPRLNDTISVIEELERNGVDMVELGIPYSDPIADGPTIQESSAIALQNGMRIKVLFEQLSELRQRVSIPVVLMSYFNPVNVFGFEKFCQYASNVGIDGLIIPDLPCYEYKAMKYDKIVNENNLTFNMLITSETPEDRIWKIDKMTNGFIYMVSTTATTGGTNGISESQINYFKKVSEMNLKNPLMVGFGVHNKQTFEEATSYCNGAIIGSAFIRILRKSSNIENGIKEFVASLKG